MIEVKDEEQSDLTEEETTLVTEYLQSLRSRKTLLEDITLVFNETDVGHSTSRKFRRRNDKVREVTVERFDNENVSITVKNVTYQVGN